MKTWQTKRILKLPSSYKGLIWGEIGYFKGLTLPQYIYIQNKGFQVDHRSVEVHDGDIINTDQYKLYWVCLYNKQKNMSVERILILNK